jgi:hypothetical protein
MVMRTRLSVILTLPVLFYCVVLFGVAIIFEMLLLSLSWEALLYLNLNHSMPNSVQCTDSLIPHLLPVSVHHRDINAFKRTTNSKSLIFLFYYIYRTSFIILCCDQQCTIISQIPVQHDSIINIQTVYTATTQTGFMRIVATKWY